MKTITTSELNTVTGGASKADSALTSQLTALQGSIKDLAANNSNQSSSDQMLPMMMMMAMNKPAAPTVVATSAPAPAAGPIVNISNRFRRW